MEAEKILKPIYAALIVGSRCAAATHRLDPGKPPGSIVEYIDEIIIHDNNT